MTKIRPTNRSTRQQR